MQSCSNVFTSRTITFVSRRKEAHWYSLIFPSTRFRIECVLLSFPLRLFLSSSLRHPQAASSTVSKGVEATCSEAWNPRQSQPRLLTRQRTSINRARVLPISFLAEFAYSRSNVMNQQNIPIAENNAAPTEPLSIWKLRPSILDLHTPNLMAVCVNWVETLSRKESLRNYLTR